MRKNNKVLFLLFFSIIAFPVSGQVIFSKSSEKKPWSSADQTVQTRLEPTYMGQFIHTHRADSSGGSRLYAGLPPGWDTTRYKPFIRSFSTKNQTPDWMESSSKPDSVMEDSVPAEADTLRAKRLVDLALLTDSVRRLDERLYGLTTVLEANINSRRAVLIQQLLRDVPSIFPILIRPAERLGLRSSFGLRVHPLTGKLQNHSGIDLARPLGTPVYATADGVVERIVWQPTGLGLGIYLRHASGYRSVYGHLAGSYVEVGDFLQRGQVLGVVGSTGRTTGPHLHYTIFENGITVDPLPFCYLLTEQVRLLDEANRVRPLQKKSSLQAGKIRTGGPLR